MKDKDKITQCRFYFDLEKELKYINEMNKKGYKLVYIKSGCLYTFVKTQPDEYTTIFYAVEKEKVSQISAFVAQYGYESIPHTMDGFGNLLYLTGKKSEVDADFINDTDSKINFYTIMKKQFSHFCKLFWAMLAIFFIATLLLTLTAIFAKSVVLYTIAGIYIFFTVTFILGLISLIKQKKRYKKRLEELQANSIMYE